MAGLKHPDITGHQSDMEPDTGRTRTSPLEDVQLSGLPACIDASLKKGCGAPAKTKDEPKECCPALILQRYCKTVRPLCPHFQSLRPAVINAVQRGYGNRGPESGKSDRFLCGAGQ